jgi:hypothetical protein
MNESEMKRSDWANAESRRCPNVSAAMFCVCNRGVFGIERVDKPFSSSELEQALRVYSIISPLSYVALYAKSA